MNYEEQIKRLSEITSMLEHEQLSLEEAAKLYAEGMDISSKCHKILQEAVMSIQEIPVPLPEKA